MILHKTYKKYWTDLTTRNVGITRVEMVTKEDDLIKKIKSLDPDQIILMVIIPSYDSDAPDADNLSENGTGMIWVLEKTDRTNLDDARLDDIMEETQKALLDVRELMLADKNICGNIMRHLDTKSIHVDPEFDLHGCYGWSMSFNLTDMNFFKQ